MASNSEHARFLDRLAGVINEKTTDAPLLVVLPNRRSLFVLQKKIESEQEVELTTIDDLMQQLTGSKLIEPEELQVTFYQAYIQKEKNPQTFDQFISWAVTFLSDINDLDLHLGDISALYQHISDYHQTGESFQLDDAGPIEHAYLGFWERLPGYYQMLRSKLDQLQLAYRGLIYRKAAEMAEENTAELQAFFNGKEIFWVGIIPGNPSERRLLQWIDTNAKLKVFADIDDHYLKMPQHEAGRLFHANPLEGDVSWKVNLLRSQPKTFKIHPVPGNTAQVVTAKKLLDQIDLDEWPDTVIVMADSTLLVPFIQVFSGVKDRLNITSGFPMKSTLIHRFIMSWLTLHAQAVRRNGNVYFYHKHVEEFLDYSVVKAWLSGAMSWSALRKEIVEDNLKFISLDWLKVKMSEDLFAEKAFFLLFDWPDELEEVFERINTVLSEWSENTASLAISTIEAEAISSYIARLKLMLAQFNELLPQHDLKALRKFVHRQIGYTKLFIEQPKNDALQVMGMLETRMIDFKRVIVLGGSDDFLPGNPTTSTHIPFIHRLRFNLPTKRDTEALMAYHFYRLLQRAAHIDVIYSTAHEAMSTGEPSRYLFQIREELLSQNAEMSWVQSDYNVTINSKDFQPLQIEKNEDVLKSIRAFLSRSVSASALNKFINSPLEFYYYYVLKLKEQDEVEEEIEATTLGSVVHQVLEEAYQPFIGRSVGTRDVKALIEPAVRKVDVLFAEQFSKEDLATGRNLLTVELAKHYVQAFLEFEIKDVEEHGAFEIISLEERLMYPVAINGESVRLFGFVDRIDRRNGKIRIIDYKTGKVESNQLNYDSEEMAIDRKFDKALQLALYQYMYCHINDTAEDLVDSCIFSFQNISAGYQSMKADEVAESFQTVLETIVSEMLDPTKELSHRETSMYTTF